MNGRMPVIVLVMLIFASACRQGQDQSSQTINLTYPPAPRDTSVGQSYHGLPVSAPYRWLETNNTNTKTWLEGQRTLSERYFNAIRKIDKTVYQDWAPITSYSAPFKKGDQYFISLKEGQQPQPALFRIDDPYDSRLKSVFPEKRSSLTEVNIEHIQLSSDGKLVAVVYRENSGSWLTVQVADVASGSLFSEQLKWVRSPAIAWWGNGFFYTKSPEPPPGKESTDPLAIQEVYYHRVGDTQTEDELIFANRGAAFTHYQPSVTSDGKYLLLKTYRSNGGNGLYFKRLDKDDDFIELIPVQDYHFDPIDRVGRRLLVRTNFNAPNYQLVAMELREKRGNPKYWRKLVSEKEEVLVDVKPLNKKLALKYQSGGIQKLNIHDEQGKPEREIRLPMPGTLSEITADEKDKFAYFTFSTLIQPPTVYEADLGTGEAIIYREPDNSFDGSLFDLKEVTFESYDGTRVNMMIVHRNSLASGVPHPTLLLAVNGPINQFDPTQIGLIRSFLANNGICALVNIRGNTGYGSKWTAAGSKSGFQSALDDFQSAADYLIANRYTSPAQLAVYGEQVNALIAIASAIQRPELYQCVVTKDGVFDLLEYQNFSTGRLWSNRLGTSNDPKEFDYLYALSPVHNAIPNKYPATLLLTSTTSDLPSALHTYKMAAALQANQLGPAPVLVNAAPGLPSTAARTKGLTNKVVAFLFYHLGTESRTTAND